MNSNSQIVTLEAKKTPSALQGFMFAILAATLWGVSGTCGQFLFQKQGINVEWMITVRMLVSGAVLLLIAFIKEKKGMFDLFKNRKDALSLLIFSLTGMLAVQYTYFAAIKHSNAATATVMQYAGPVLITAYLALKNKKIPKIAEFAAIILAVVGTFLLVTHGKFDSLSISKTAFFWGITSAFALAVYTLQPVKLLQKYSSTSVVGWGMLIGGIAFSFVKAPWNVEGIWDSKSYAYTAFIIIFGTLIAFYIFLTAVKIIGAQKSSVLASAEPLSATIIAVLWLNIPFTKMDWIGSACIISTIFILSYAGKLK